MTRRCSDDASALRLRSRPLPGPTPAGPTITAVWQAGWRFATPMLLALLLAVPSLPAQAGGGPENVMLSLIHI